MILWFENRDRNILAKYSHFISCYPNQRLNNITLIKKKIKLQGGFIKFLHFLFAFGVRENMYAFNKIVAEFSYFLYIHKSPKLWSLYEYILLTLYPAIIKKHELIIFHYQPS